MSARRRRAGSCCCWSRRCSRLAVGLRSSRLTGVGERLERQSVDARFDSAARRPPPPDVVIVAIDDKTLDAADEPLPAQPRAPRAGDRAAHEGRRRASIAYDVQFTEESDDPDADDALVEAVARRARRSCSAPTEVADDGTTQIFGGGEGLELQRRRPRERRAYDHDGDGGLRRMPFARQHAATRSALAAARAAARRAGRAPRDGHAGLDRLPGPARHVPVAELRRRRSRPSSTPRRSAARSSSSARRRRARQDCSTTRRVGQRQHARAGDPGGGDRDRARRLPAARRVRAGSMRARADRRLASSRPLVAAALRRAAGRGRPGLLAAVAVPPRRAVRVQRAARSLAVVPPLAAARRRRCAADAARRAVRSARRGWTACWTG